MLKVKMRLESEENSGSSENENLIRPPMEPVSYLNQLQTPQIHSKLDMIAQTYKEFRHLPSPLTQTNGLESIYNVQDLKNTILKMRATQQSLQESDNHSAHFNGHIDSVGADINVPIQSNNQLSQIFDQL
jgi:hypothetical protein